jgi:histidyl-tRNA synthetase
MKVDTDYLNRSLKSAFKQAEKFQAKKIIVLGDQEVATQTVTIKDQIKKTTKTVPIKELEKFLREKA